ncbi:palmitoyl-acyl carrier protein thioesterase, chloroplastic-like [Tasmannia lanceolata]|uniref:palmitoyl-acyl carrier protein thioesterase, chloroplastic-like n=1 Tax=Tasmannia lanceolata TaxID=3420 RepID=UPI004062ED97
MASLYSHAFYYPTKCSSDRENGPTSHIQKLNSIKLNGSTSMATTKVDGLSQSVGATTAAAFTSVASVAETAYTERKTNRQNIPTKKQLVDPFRQGLIIEGDVGYRQTVVIRSYEVGPDNTATLESILNLLQETALNHVWMSGLLGDGFGATHGMIRNSLIWVVTRMQVQVDSYPIWGEVVEIDTWVGASGKNGMRRDWMIRSHLTGHVFGLATSTWVMMNQQTRCLSKMPEEVRAEISPWFVNRQAIQEDLLEKIIKLDDKAKYANSDLKPKRSDLDMNHHVNNVKYVGWMLEAIPDLFFEGHQLSSIILEYRRECGSSEMVQSLCEPDEDSIHEEENDMNLRRRFSLTRQILEGHGLLGSFDKWPLRYTHLLQIKGESKNEEIVRGRTTWRKKVSTKPFST